MSNTNNTEPATNALNVTQPFGGHDIRICGTNENPLFCAADVCAALELCNPRDAVSSLDSDEKGVAIADTLGGQQEMTFITESGLYHLIFKSRKPVAKKFRRWVTTEVIPAIRKTGGYTAPVQTEVMKPTAPRPAAMTALEWYASLGLDVRTDIQKISELDTCLDRAINRSRWYATPSQNRNAEFFQVIPTVILERAEAIHCTGYGQTRKIAGPSIIDVTPAESPDPGGTIAQILARRHQPTNTTTTTTQS
jgi:prophage antirepressor-like protein